MDRRTLSRKARLVASVVGPLSSLAALLAVTAAPATAAPAPAAPVAQAAAPAAQGGHYYILIPGTCDGANHVYDNVDFKGGIPLKVHYAASAPGVCGDMPYNQSVEDGRFKARAVIEQAYRNDPSGEFTVVGYSQGAQVANRLLEDIADGRTIVPKGQVNAKLYADPMQPVTGIGAVFPKGMAIPFGGYVSPGPGRTDFGGIPYLRYCIETDGVCDNRRPWESIGGYFAQHSCYAGHVFWTITDGVYSNASHFWPRINCRPPWPVL